MKRHHKTVVAAAACIMLSILASVRVAAHETESIPNKQRLEMLWGDLLKDEPTPTRAVLTLAKSQGHTIAFLIEKLKPLTLTSDRLTALIQQLGSQVDSEWRDAVRELEYYDPRLAMNVEELMTLDAVQTYPVRHRLVDILSDRPVDEEYSATSRGFKFLKIRTVGDEGFNFCGGDKEEACGTSWWAEHKIDRLNVGFSNSKREWTRIIRSLALLESFESPEAIAVIETIASRHPEAQPTKIAIEMLTRRIRK
jgi:hypothetical protein